jgi:hypothetical protein
MNVCHVRQTSAKHLALIEIGSRTSAKRPPPYIDMAVGGRSMAVMNIFQRPPNVRQTNERQPETHEGSGSVRLAPARRSRSKVSLGGCS